MSNLQPEDLQRNERSSEHTEPNRQPWKRPELHCIDFKPEGLGGNFGDGFANFC